MSNNSNVFIAFLIAFSMLLFSGCVKFNFKDTEENRIDIDDRGITVTSPDGIEVYKHDAIHDNDVFYDKDIDRHIEIHNSDKEQ